MCQREPCPQSFRAATRCLSHRAGWLRNDGRDIHTRRPQSAALVCPLARVLLVARGGAALKADLLAS